MERIIISDEFGQHGLDIKTAISIGYGSDISEEIQIIPYWEPALAEARNNQNIIAIIRSTQGVAGYVHDAQSISPRVLTFMPLGGTQNIFADGNVFQNQEPPVIVTSGAGDDELRNNTAYGNGLEFWDGDLYNENLSQDGTQRDDDASSFSNGIILGKLLKIKDELNCTWWEARYRARMTADRNEPNRVTSFWDYRNGYGKINVASAIAFVGVIPADIYYIAPIVPEPPQLGVISILSAINVNGKITGTIGEVINSTSYIIFKNGEFLFQINSLTFNDYIAYSNNTYRYTYKAVRQMSGEVFQESGMSNGNHNLIHRSYRPSRFNLSSEDRSISIYYFRSGYKCNYL